MNKHFHTSNCLLYSIPPVYCFASNSLWNQISVKYILGDLLSRNHRYFLFELLIYKKMSLETANLDQQGFFVSFWRYYTCTQIWSVWTNQWIITATRSSVWSPAPIVHVDLLALREWFASRGGQVAPRMVVPVISVSVWMSAWRHVVLKRFQRSEDEKRDLQEPFSFPACRNVQCHIVDIVKW